MEVETKNGKFSLKRPTAGQRNAALMKAETPDGIKNTVFLIELLPMCVREHPFGMIPIKQGLDGMDMEDYDKLIDGLAKIITPDKELAKKSLPPSEQGEQVTVG